MQSAEAMRRAGQGGLEVDAREPPLHVRKGLPAGNRVLLAGIVATGL